MTRAKCPECGKMVAVEDGTFLSHIKGDPRFRHGPAGKVCKGSNKPAKEKDE